MGYGYDFNVTPVQVENGTDYQARKDAAAARKIELQQRQLQLTQAKKAQADQDARDSAAKSAYQPSSYTPPDQSLNVGGANLGYQPAQVQGPAQFNRGSYIQNLQQSDPLGAMQAQQGFQQSDQEQQMKQVQLQEALTKADSSKLSLTSQQLELTARMLGAVKNAPPELQAQVYQGVRQKAIQSGVVQPNDPNVPEQYMGPQWIDQQLNSVLPVKDQVDNEIKRRGQDMTAQTAAAGQAVTMRGQNMTDRRSRDANAVAAQKKDATQEAIETAAQSIASGDMTRLKDISSMRGQDRLLIFNRVKQLNPNFNTSEVDRKIKMMDDFTNGKDGQNLQSFGTFLEHAGEASDVVNQYRAGGSPLINKPLNWFRKNASGDPSYIQFVTSLEPVRKEFEGFLLGGKALYGDDRKAAETILSDDSSPAQIQSALKQMGHTVKARYNESNYRYKRVMGSDLQDAVSPEALEGAKKIGVSMGASKPTLTNQNQGSGQRPSLSSFEK